MNSYGLAWAIPFVGLLLTIGLAPLIAPRLWQQHYGKLAAFWALAFLVADIVHEGGGATLHAATGILLLDYLPFILLLGALFVIAGGLHVTGLPRASPGVNTALLALGVVLSNIIGTTGATMVMLRPIMRANRHRQRTTHVFIFFIFLVANIGGALTPLGNPPIFLGFLLGVPFFWPTVHLALPTLLLVAALLATFYALDSVIGRRGRRNEPEVLAEIEKLGVNGKINLAMLALAVVSVLLHAFWKTTVSVDIFGVEWGLVDIVSDAMLFASGLLSFLLTRPSVHRANEFSWQPIIEVAALFAAIFVTLVPVMAIIAAGPSGPAAPLMAHLFVDGAPYKPAFYWLTGTLSALLDNAPTYVVFFGFAGNNPALLTGSLAGTLQAISAGAVFFGGMTYIGSAANLMVKGIVEGTGIRMPNFITYLAWSGLCLLPWLVVVDFVFFH